jgi:hypothetical protein
MPPVAGDAARARAGEPMQSWAHLHVAAFYQDALTRNWALLVCDHAAQLIHQVAVHST